jgi:hypothetical protein
MLGTGVITGRPAMPIHSFTAPEDPYASAGPVHLDLAIYEGEDLHARPKPLNRYPLRNIITK